MSNRLSVWRRMVDLTWRTSPGLTLVVIVLIAIQAFSLVLAGLSQRWVVDAASDHVGPGLLAAVVLGGVAYAIEAAGVRVKNNYRVDIIDRVDLGINADVLSMVTAVPTIEHLERADYVDRIALVRNQTRTLADSVWAIAETASAVVSVLLTAWVLSSIHPALLLLTVFSIAPFWAANQAHNVTRRARKESAELLRHEHRLHQLCLSPDSAKEVYLSRAGEVIGAAAMDARKECLRRQLRAHLAATGLQLLGWVVLAAGLIGAVLIVVTRVRSGDATLGDVVLLVTVGTRLRVEMGDAIFGASRIAEAREVVAQFEWLRWYAAEAPARTAARAPEVRVQDGIRFDQVSFTYPGTDHPVLKDVDLLLAAGETVAIVGVNGAGKSTLVSLLTGMHSPTAGQLTVDGESLDQIGVERWRHATTGAFQDFVRYEVPVIEAVGVGDLDQVEDRSRVAEALSWSGASDFVERLPEGMQTQLGTAYGGMELSTGQWQKLALARSYMRRTPTLVVLDEPSASLDAQAEHDAYERFAALSTPEDGRITLLVSHRFSTVRMADRIVVIDDGAVRETGTHDELMALDGVYARMYTTQAQAYLGS